MPPPQFHTSFNLPAAAASSSLNNSYPLWKFLHHKSLALFCFYLFFTVCRFLNLDYLGFNLLLPTSESVCVFKAIVRPLLIQHLDSTRHYNAVLFG